MTDPEPQVWNGEPIIALTRAQKFWLHSLMPNWHGEAIGPPVPFGVGLIRFTVTGILVETRDEAAEAIWRHIEQTCIEQGLVFDPEDWQVVNIHMANSC